MGEASVGPLLLRVVGMSILGLAALIGTAALVLAAGLDGWRWLLHREDR